MFKKSRYIFVIIFILIIAYFLLGFSNSTAIDAFAYALAIGIDESETSDLKFTFQFSKASKSSETVEGSQYIFSVDSTSLDAAISLLNNYLTKPVNLSHCKVIIISEAVAAKGIEKFISTLMNSVDIRPDTTIIISKSKGQEFIENADAKFETLISTYYEIATSSNNYTSYTDYVKITDFLNSSQSFSSEPYAILGNVYDNDSENCSFGATKVEQSQISDGSGVETLGLAVFKENKLVGELSAIQTIAHLLITNNLKTCIVSVENPLNRNELVDLFLYSPSTPKISVKFINNSPFVSVDLKIKAKILSSSSANNLDNDYFELISDELNKYLTDIIEDYLYTISKEYNSDIAGIGKFAAKNFLTIDDFEDYDWLDNFEDCFFDANVDSNVISDLLLNWQQE